MVISPLEYPNNLDSKITNSTISQSTLPKKPVSRMYSSLYSSSQIKPKGGNATNMKDYEKLYKDFLRSKRTEHTASSIEEH